MDQAIKMLVSIAITALFSISAVYGQQVFQSLEEIWTFALKNNGDHELQALQVEKALADQKIAGSLLYPKVKGTFSGQHNVNIAATPVPGELLGRPGEVEYVQFGLPYIYQAGITINKTLIDWQSIYQSKIAKTNSKLKEAEKSYFEQHLKEQVAQIYYATLTGQAVVENAQKELLLADSLLLITADRFQEGLIDVIALNQAKINKNNAFERLEQNWSYFNANVFTLKNLLGMQGADSLIFEEQINLISPEFLISIPDNEASLKPYEIQHAITDLERKRALSNFSPKLDLISSWSKIQYQENFSFSLNANDWLSNSFIGLNLSVPIYSGSANKHQLNAAKIAHNIARLSYDEALRKSSIGDRILLNNYQSSFKLAQSVKQSLQVSEENVQLAYMKYAEGLISLDNYLSVHDDYLTIQNQYFSRLSDYLINKATILSRNK